MAARPAGERPPSERIMAPLTADFPAGERARCAPSVPIMAPRSAPIMALRVADFPAGDRPRCKRCEPVMAPRAADFPAGESARCARYSARVSSAAAFIGKEFQFLAMKFTARMLYYYL